MTPALPQLCPSFAIAAPCLDLTGPLFPVAMRVTAFLAAAALLSAAALPASAQLRLAPDPAVAAFEEKVEQAYETGDFVGLAVAVVKDGRVTLMRAFGERAASGSQAVDHLTRFRIASLSKGFAATVAAQLAAEGRLALDQPVGEMAPFFRLRSAAQSGATMEHVLSHRLGLPPFAYDNLLEAHIPVETIFDRLAKVKLVCRVGDCFTYQNVAYSLVEPAVEKAAGLPFERAVEARLFAPLGMERASFGLEALLEDDNWARPHVKTRAGWHPVKPDTAYYQVPSAGGINASILDMARWLKAQMGHAPDILAPPVLEMLHTPQVLTRAELRKIRWLRPRVKRAHYGLGWRVYSYAGHPVVVHNGGLEGTRAQIAFAPEEDVGVVAMWNSTTDRGWGIMPTLMDAWFGLKDMDWLRLDCGGKGRDAVYCEPKAVSVNSTAR